MELTPLNTCRSYCMGKHPEVRVHLCSHSFLQTVALDIRSTAWTLSIYIWQCALFRMPPHALTYGTKQTREPIKLCA